MTHIRSMINFIFEVSTLKMRNKITIIDPDVINIQRINSSDDRTVLLPDLAAKKSNLEIIMSEGSEDFVSYLEWLGFLKDPDLIVLSPTHHYYYDAEEMKSVRTVVNLIELNQVREVDSFFHSMFNLLPQKSYFVGCFTDSQKKNRYSLKNRPATNNQEKDNEENSITSRIPFLRMLYNLLDSRINKYLSKSEVKTLLNDHGFKVKDMTELNGLTYFCTQKQLTVVN